MIEIISLTDEGNRYDGGNNKKYGNNSFDRIILDVSSYQIKWADKLNTVQIGLNKIDIYDNYITVGSSKISKIQLLLAKDLMLCDSAYSNSTIPYISIGDCTFNKKEILDIVILLK